MPTHTAPSSVRAFRGRRSDGGAVATEFILVSPLLVLMIIGMINLALAWNTHNVLDHAAREAARYAATSVPFNQGDVLSVAEGVLTSNSVGTGTLQSCIAQGDGSATCPGVNLGSFDTVPHVEVVLTIPDFEMNFIFFTASPTMRAAAVARYEG